MVTPFLCPFNQPQMQTFGEFVAFFTQICEVCPIPLAFLFHSNIHWSRRAFDLCMSKMCHIGMTCHSFKSIPSLKVICSDCTANNIMFEGLHQNSAASGLLFHLSRQHASRGKWTRLCVEQTSQRQSID